MRIGITGAQSVGKTTLLNCLRSEAIFKDYIICDEVTRKVQKNGFKINEQGGDETQLAIMNMHIDNLKHNNMITDRTSLDGYVYSIYLHDNKNIKRVTLEKVYEIYLETIEKYDYLFYIPPEFEIESDGVRSVNQKFRNDIVQIFKDNYVKCPHKDITVLTGSVKERIEKVLRKINE